MPITGESPGVGRPVRPDRKSASSCRRRWARAGRKTRLRQFPAKRRPALADRKILDDLLNGNGDAHGINTDNSKRRAAGQASGRESETP